MSTPVDLSPAPRPERSMPHCESTIECLPVDCADLPATAEIARFCGPAGMMEHHITVRLAGGGGTDDPMSSLAMAYQRALGVAGLDASSAVFRRFFCSDVVNQAALLDPPSLERLFGATATCADSLLRQSPLPAAKFALWAYHLDDPSATLRKMSDGATVSCRRGSLTHYWSSGLIDPCGEGSGKQTEDILDAYDNWLESHDMNMAGHVIRTWWFVQNIDGDYQGLVDARREFFETHGLTPDTHYIASTGIAGAHREVAARVSLDSYAIGGVSPEQITYISAADHLCPTYDYGVTFERATAVDYADRRHIFISGTASIDTAGLIVHEGDVLGQLDRTLENIEALLAQASANLGDLASIIVYLRDPADGDAVEAALKERLGATPYVLVEAAVCRPGWLIEIEGIAIVSTSNSGFPEF